MKKLFAILLAVSMLLTMTALAEEEGQVVEVDEEAATQLILDDVLNFDITMDAIPEGYTMEKKEQDGVLYAFFTGEGKTDITVSVAHSELFDGFTLVLDELTDEDTANMISGLCEGFFNASVSFTKTTHGTDLIVVNENDVETDYVTIVAIYEGYIIGAELFNDEGEVAQADIDTAVQIISDMWFVKAE